MRDRFGNIKSKRRSGDRDYAPVYLICILILILTVALDVYFIMGIFS